MCRQIFTNCKIGGTQRERKKEPNDSSSSGCPQEKEASIEDFSQQQNTSSDVFASSHLFYRV